MNEEQNKTKKHKWPKAMRILALILAVLLLGEIVVSSSAAVSFSSKKYEDTDYEQAADYIANNDSYLTADKLKRMRAVISLLGEPETYDQYSLFASVAIADEDYAKAAKYLREGIDIYKGENDVLASDYIKIGCLEALQDKWEEAVADLEKAVELDESNSNGWLMLCESYLNVSQYEKALSALEKYSTFENLSEEEFEAKIQLQINLGKYEDALLSCDEAENKGSFSISDIDYYRAQTYYMSGEYELCKKAAQQSQANGGDPSENCLLVALSCEALGQTKEALSACDDLIKKGSADISVYLHAAQLAYELTDYTTAISISEEGRNKFKDNPDASSFNNWIGVSYFDMGDYENAQKVFTDMLDDGESLPEVRYLRGICEMSTEDYDKAVEDFTASLESEELYDESLYNRALCYIKLENEEAAAADFQTIIDRGQSPETIQLIYDLLGIEVQ